MGADSVAVTTTESHCPVVLYDLSRGSSVEWSTKETIKLRPPLIVDAESVCGKKEMKTYFPILFEVMESSQASLEIG